VPALTSTVLELIDAAGRAHLCDELREGACYRVVITTPGGLYRYDLGDTVRCRGHDGLLPLLEFVGRDVASDLVGEKLSEAFVSEALGAFEGAACLAPRAAAQPFYELLVEPHPGRAPPAAAAVDERLCANPQYAYARRIGQLGPLVVRPVERLLDRHARAELVRGRRLADIKPPVLVAEPRLYDALTNEVDSGNSVFRVPFSPGYPGAGDSARRVG
jgi:hypothetical protein